MLKRLVISGAAAVALMGLGVHLSAYVLSGHRWASGRVPFYVNPVNLDISEDAAITALQAGASRWRTQSTADVDLYYAGRTTGSTLANDGKNQIFFRNTASGSTIASTYWWYDGTNKLVDADMIFYDGGFKFFTGSTGCSGGFFVEDIATHEFGHFIGINHSADTTATMYASYSGWCNTSWRFLAQDDITAVQALYPASSTTPSTPTAPSALAASLATTVPQVKLSWRDNASNETGFRVERSTDGLNFTIVGQPGVNATSFLDQSTAAGKTYQYRVRAYNANGVSSASNMASVQTGTTTSTTLPAPATVFSPKNGSRIAVATTNYLRWYAAARATSYDVYFGTSSNPAKIATVIPPAGVSPTYPGTLYNAVTLRRKKTYYWKIVSKNAAGSATSSTWKFSTK
jgi:hypothetical protein